MKNKKRCVWATQDPIYIAYHDQEWGRPLKNDQQLFEMLILEGAQAGLSWLTILKRRAGYRAAFANFDAKKIVRFSPEKIKKLMQDPGIIRNRLKIESVITNAKALLQLQKEQSLTDYLWGFVDHKPILNHFSTASAVPTRSEMSDRLAKDLKRRGFKFVGTTICYAFMQAVGMVNDHTADCFLYQS